MENEALQLAHRKQYVVQTTQNTEKMFGEFSDKLIKFAEQIHFPQPNLGESSQGKQFSCLDHHQCSKDEEPEPGVFHRLDLILTNYSFFFFFFFLLNSQNQLQHCHKNLQKQSTSTDYFI